MNRGVNISPIRCACVLCHANAPETSEYLVSEAGIKERTPGTPSHNAHEDSITQCLTARERDLGPTRIAERF